MSDAVYQLTLRGFDGNTGDFDNCIKWVKAPNREVFDRWLDQTGVRALLISEDLEGVDTNPSAEYGFDDGVDVYLHADGSFTCNPAFNLTNETVFELWQATVQKAEASNRRKKRKFGPPLASRTEDGPRIIIYVSGGNVQSIKTNTPNVKIDVLDEDNRKDMEEDSIDADEYDELEKEYDNLPHSVY